MRTPQEPVRWSLVDEDEPSADELVPQLARPSLPIRVPLAADFGSGSIVQAQVIGATDDVMLLQGPATGAAFAPIGAPIRLRLLWDRQVLSCRLAAHGVGGRFLVTIGERGVRRSKRVPIDLPAVARGALLAAPVEVRLVDLSATGALVQGLALAVGSEVGLSFTPPGQSMPISVLGFVVRLLEQAEAPSVGLAFRLVQPAMDRLQTVHRAV